MKKRRNYKRRKIFDYLFTQNTFFQIISFKKNILIKIKLNEIIFFKLKFKRKNFLLFQEDLLLNIEVTIAVPISFPTLMTSSSVIINYKNLIKKYREIIRVLKINLLSN